MKSLKLALVGASFLLGAAGAASAADVYQRGSLKDAGEAYYPAISWTGFYVGAHAGGAFGGEVESDAAIFDDGSNSADLGDAFIAGVQIGYNWQAAEHWVIGIEGSASYLPLEVDDGGAEFSDYVASIRGRAGVTFDQNLVYGTAGVAFLGHADEFADAFGEDTAVGFVIGAGWERKITDNVSFGVEGLYYDFTTEPDGAADVDSDFFTVTARLNYHFTSGYSQPLK